MLKSKFDPKQNYNAVAYLRMSTAEQNERSPDQQLAEISRHLKASGLNWPIVRTYRDEGISGRKLRNRIGYQSMLREIKTGQIQVDLILVDTLERFGRVDDLQSIRKELSEKHGVLVLTADSNFTDPTSVQGRALGFVESIRATEDGRIKAHNVLRGKRDAAIQKHWPGGPAPFGFKLQSVMKCVNGREEVDYCLLLPDPNTDWIIRYVFSLAETRSWGGIRIAKELRLHPDLPSNYKANPSTTINYWLGNSIYVGDLVFAKNSTGIVNDTRVVVSNAEEDIVRVENFCEPIITRECWERVQEIRLARSEKMKLARGIRTDSYGKKIKAHGCGIAIKYPLSGLVYCSECGNRMRYFSSSQFRTRAGEKRNYGAYRCVKYHDGLCTNNRRVPENWLWKTVINTLGARLFPGLVSAPIPEDNRVVAAVTGEGISSMSKTENVALADFPWLSDLTDQVNLALQERNDNQPDMSSALKKELSIFQGKTAGWLMSLANPNLSSDLRLEIESLWSRTVEEQKVLERQLTDLASQIQDIDELVDRSDVLNRLARLGDILVNE